MEADQQLQNEPYDEEYLVNDGEDVESNLAVTPDQRNGDLGDEMEDDDARGDSPPDHHDDGLDDEEYDDDEHDDELDPMSPDLNGSMTNDSEALGQRDHDFGEPGYGTGDPAGEHEEGDYGNLSPEGGDGMGDGATDTEDDDDGVKVEGAYDPADYQGLAVSSDIKELFTYITRYTPVSQELETKLKPFIPDFIPAVGDIDAMIKINRVDGQDQGLGLAVLDEPCAAQSDPTVLDLQLRAISKTTTTKAVAVKQVGGGGAAAGKAIDSWINSITELHREKPPQSVNYSTVMPEIETLMQEWPTEFEELLSTVRLPTADLNCTLKEYVHIVCSITDIPIHKSRVESLHLLFTLFSEFKNSQHFRSADEIAEAEVGAAADGDAPEGVQGDIMTFD